MKHDTMKQLPSIAEHKLFNVQKSLDEFIIITKDDEDSGHLILAILLFSVDNEQDMKQ
jgi:hypothetical protein